MVIVTHYPGVAEHVDRVVHIRDGRISSESFMRSSFQRSGTAVQQEYLVVDRAGRLQLPREYLDQLHLEGLARADLVDHQVTIQPARENAPAPAETPTEPTPASPEDPDALFRRRPEGEAS